MKTQEKSLSLQNAATIKNVREQIAANNFSLDTAEKEFKGGLNKEISELNAQVNKATLLFAGFFVV